MSRPPASGRRSAAGRGPRRDEGLGGARCPAGGAVRGGAFVAAGAAAGLLLAWSAPAAAWTPEFQAGPEVGGGFVLDDAGTVGEGIAWLGFGADVQLFRDISSDVGLGFTLRFGTRDFVDLPIFGGVEGLFPIHEALPLILGAGAGVNALTGDGLWYARLWWGARSHNQLSRYSTGVGIFVEYQRAITGESEPMLLFGACVDGFVLLWPFLWLYQWAAVDQGPEVV